MSHQNLEVLVFQLLFIIMLILKNAVCIAYSHKVNAVCIAYNQCPLTEILLSYY